jgi:peptidoglycan/LPS O-acetylase OafA/YrhL
VVVLADLLSHRSRWLGAGLSHPAPVAIGRRSYGLYLYHWPVFLFVGVDTRPQVLAAAFGLSFAAAWLSYSVIEQPFLRMKRRWSARPGEERHPHVLVPAPVDRALDAT